MFLYSVRASLSSVSTPILLSTTSPYWFKTRYVGIALLVDGRRKSSVFVNSLFKAPGNKTLSSGKLRLQHLFIPAYFSAFGVDATLRRVCHTGSTFRNPDEPLAQTDGLLRALQQILRDSERNDIVGTVPSYGGPALFKIWGSAKVPRYRPASAQPADVRATPRRV
jgi:hypothetical protein